MRSGFSGLEIALQTPLPRAKGHRARGLPISPTLGVGLWRGVSNWRQVRFSADTRGESRRRSSTLAADFVGALRAVHMPKEKRGGFGANKFARKPAALFLPASSVLNRPCFCFELRARADSPRFRGSLRGGLRRPLATAFGGSLRSGHTTSRRCRSCARPSVCAASLRFRRVAAHLRRILRGEATCGRSCGAR